MKALLLLILLAGPQLALAESNLHIVTGFTHITSTQPFTCNFAPPTHEAAEASADEQAAEICGANAHRVSDFTYSVNNCVWGGPQYHYATDYLYAQAQYLCD